MIRYQRTIKNSTTCKGIGLHSGKPVTLTLRPAPADTGVVFVRKDLRNATIKAVAANTAATSYATTLQKNGAFVQTVEHLLAALAGLGISNVYADLDAEEVPIMDGSAGPFIRMIVDAGIQTQNKVQPVLKVSRPVFVRDGDKQVAIWPAETTSISCFIDFDHPLLRQQSLNYSYSEEDFIREVADARTFGFLADVQALQAAGLARGGSLENAIVLNETAVLNKEGLRYHDEFVRHKILDVMGDLFLAGMPIIGHIVAHKSGHNLNSIMVEKVLQSPLNWVQVGDMAASATRREQEAYQQPVGL